MFQRFYLYFQNSTLIGYYHLRSTLKLDDFITLTPLFTFNITNVSGLAMERDMFYFYKITHKIVTFNLWKSSATFGSRARQILSNFEGSCRWKLSSGNLYSFIRPYQGQLRKMQL